MGTTKRRIVRLEQRLRPKALPQIVVAFEMGDGQWVDDRDKPVEPEKAPAGATVVLVRTRQDGPQ